MSTTASTTTGSYNINGQTVSAGTNTFHFFSWSNSSPTVIVVDGDGVGEEELVRAFEGDIEGMIEFEC